MHRIIHFESIDSTNEYLKTVATEAEDGLVAVADEQTMGKGRMGRQWISQKGQGAWFSLLVKRDGINKENVSGLVFVCALAAARSLSRLTGNRDILIKWPNDIVLHGKKLAGILCESGFSGEEIRFSVCGIGINLTGEHFPSELPWAGSVLSETGVCLSAGSVIHAFLEEYDAALELMLKGGVQAVLDEIKYMSATLGRTVEATLPDGKLLGKAVSFAPDGALIIKTANGLVKVNAGDVSVRGIMGYTD